MLDILVLPGELRVPLVFLPLLLERHICRGQADHRLLRAPGGIHCVRDGFAQPRVRLVVRTAGQQAKRVVHVVARRGSWRETIQDFRDDLLILDGIRVGLFRRVQVFLETRLKNPVVVNVPALSIPCEHLRLGIEFWNVLSKKRPRPIRR